MVRRLGRGLRGSLGRKCLFRPLGSRRSRAFDQCQRAPGHRESSPVVCSTSRRVFGSNLRGQLYGHCLPEEPRRDSFFSSELHRSENSLRWAENLPVVISPQFIMGKHNVLADSLSRPNQILGSEWTLKQEVFRDLCKRWPVSIDLFATSQNHQCSIYFSPYHDQNALGTECSSSELGWVAGVCLSSLVPHSSSSEEAPVVLWGPADHHSSILAPEAVVSGSARSGGRRSGRSSTVQGPSASATLPSVPSGSVQAVASCLETIKRFTRAGGFSKRVAQQFP